MGIRDWWRNLTVQGVPHVGGERAALTTTDPKPVPAGRISLDSLAFNRMTGWVVRPPDDNENFWRTYDLDTSHLDSFTPKELLDMLVDISPEISRAYWDFNRLCNPGYRYRVYELGEAGKESAAGKQHIDRFWERLRSEYGSVDIVLGRFFSGAFLRGAFCAELVLDGEARESIDLVAPDPFSVRFRKRIDPLRKEVWQPGQYQGRDFIPLDIPTFKYLPVDPAPANPYGRALAAPSLFTSIFILSLMHDVKRVIMQQGYKRMDISLNTETAMDAFSFDQQGYASLGEYIRGAMDAIKTAYARLQPDDAFIHTDIFELNLPAGTVDSDSIGAIDKILERLEKQVTRALKSNGLIMGTDNNTNETDSNRRWEIHAAGIKSLQHHCEAMLEALLTLSMQAVGIQARVEFRFSELRAAEMFRDEQTRAMNVQNSRAEYAAGFSSQNEASNKAVGHDADVPEPRENLNRVEMLQDDNSGNEVLDSGSEKRTLANLKKPVTVRVKENGNA